jgi:hypothetical protein
VTTLEAQAQEITRLARDVAEARIALANIRDVASMAVAGDLREIRRIAVAALPLIGESRHRT